MDKSTLRSSIFYYMEKLRFPADAVADILAAFDKIAANGTEFARLLQIVTDYEANYQLHFTPLHEEVERICGETQVHAYTGKLLFYLCLADALRAHYRREGIDEQIFWQSLLDFSYKLEECRLVYGINGNSTGMWPSGFFKLQLFALGRLQFELTTLKKSYTCAGITLPEGQLAIGVHIPRTGGPLLHEDVQAAYRMAADFFGKHFAHGPTVFTCHSWLLDPWNLTVLKPSANLTAFIRDFEIVETKDYADYSQLWRLFDCNYNGDPDALPADTSLRRAYVERVRRGEKTGCGRGIFIFK